MNVAMSKTEETDARRYLFDLTFDGEIGLNGKKKEAEPTFSKEELEEVKNTAYNKGVFDGKKEVTDKQNKHIESLLENINEKIIETTNKNTDFWKHQIKQMQRIALTIAKKILPAYAKKHGLHEIETVINKVMNEMGSEPRLVFRIPKIQFDAAKTIIDKIAKESAYEGKLIILEDNELEISECRIEWADGGIERDLKKLWEDIDKVMAETQTLDNENRSEEEKEEIEIEIETKDDDKTSDESIKENETVNTTDNLPSGDEK